MATVAQNLAMPRLTIRRMLESDVGDVVATERLAYAFPWSDGIFRDCLRAGYICRVAELDHVFVGYGILSVGASEAHVLNVCVHADFRVRGLGRHLMLHLIGLARSAGARSLFLEVRPSNPIAERLYHSLGMQQIGLRRGYYQAEHGREDAIVMRLSL